MEHRQTTHLTDTELYALFDRLFPDGLASQDVLTEIAPEGWERSPLLAYFHPSVERVFEERLQMHRNLETRFSKIRQRRADVKSPPPEPTPDAVRRNYQPSPVNPQEEVTELVGMCLWDIISDNHDVIAPDGRQADIGSFRGASAFLDDYLTRGQDSFRSDCMRFYMGTAFVSGRADLTPVYNMVFRRLDAIVHCLLLRPMSWRQTVLALDRVPQGRIEYGTAQGLSRFPVCFTVIKGLSRVHDGARV